MNEDRWRRIEELYHAARLLNDSVRASFLAAATEGDAELRHEVESLLVSGASSPGFLDEPVEMSGAGPRVSDVASLSGRRIGTYSIHERIGAGGMGEVYRAHDSKLRRDVALKVIAADLIGDNDQQRPDHLRRFRHEAHALAALNHPNIAAIYGLEEADGVTALVMELVDGSTLADRMLQGAIPVEEALPVAKQIAEALEAAHERGIVHRDLKPANIKLRADGTVKVLDFGLAKAMGPAVRVPDVSQRATHTAPAKTATGVIVGTAAYMSPEQASGRAVDHRTDIWAFGCVLFEMLTGRAAFGGDTLTDTLAAVMRAEPDWPQLPAATPPRIGTLLHRCLDKDNRRRLQAIAEARIVIEHVLSRVPDDSTSAQTSTSRRVSLPWGWAALLLVAVAVLSSLMAYRVGAGRAEPAALAVLRPNIDLPPGVTLSGSPALSPDGSKLVVVGQSKSKTQLYLRSLDQDETRPIEGTAEARAPFFSPDGKWVGFYADGRLQKWPLAGGLPTTICHCDAATGAAWLPDDVIVFSSRSGLQRVTVQEGRPTVIAKRDTSEGGYGSPVALPGGNAVMFSISNGVLGRRVDVLTLNDGKRIPLVDGAEQPRFIAPGFVVVNRTGTLEVAPFDTARLKVGTFARLGEGTPTAGAQTMAGGGVVVSYDVAAAGRSMVFVKAPSRDQRGVYKLTLRGEVELLSSEARPYGDPAVSPDGNKIAVDVWIKEQSNEIRVLDLVLGGWSTITSGENDWQPRWQDDHTLIYTRGQGKNRSEYWEEYAQQATSNGTPTLLASFPHTINSHAVAPKHDAVVFSRAGQSTDLWYQPLGRDGTSRQARPLIVTPAAESAISCGFSPNGRRLAYSSVTAGQRQIYVTDLPAGSAPSLVSSAGVSPCWSKDGRQIFYWNGDTVMAVTVRAGEPFSAEPPRKLFDSPVTLVEGWDVARDAFYVVGYEAGRTSSIVFVSDITANLPSRAKAQ
jgi:serine/threonine protein kinase/Tol biopolymer transport system component